MTNSEIPNDERNDEVRCTQHKRDSRLVCVLRPLVLRTPTVVRKKLLGGNVNSERLSVPPKVGTARRSSKYYGDKLEELGSVCRWSVLDRVLALV